MGRCLLSATVTQRYGDHCARAPRPTAPWTESTCSVPSLLACSPQLSPSPHVLSLPVAYRALARSVVVVVVDVRAEPLPLSRPRAPFSLYLWLLKLSPFATSLSLARAVLSCAVLARVPQVGRAVRAGEARRVRSDPGVRRVSPGGLFWEQEEAGDGLGSVRRRAGRLGWGKAVRGSPAGRRGCPSSLARARGGCSAPEDHCCEVVVVGLKAASEEEAEGKRKGW